MDRRFIIVGLVINLTIKDYFLLKADLYHILKAKALFKNNS